jgi:hypothetical protein
VSSFIIQHHQAVGVLLSCNGITLNYTMIMYDKSVSKIDTVKQIAEELPTAPTSSYLLCDSWRKGRKCVHLQRLSHCRSFEDESYSISIRHKNECL